MSYDREQLETIKFSVVLQATFLFSFYFIVKGKYPDGPTEQFWKIIILYFAIINYSFFYLWSLY